MNRPRRSRRTGRRCADNRQSVPPRRGRLRPARGAAAMPSAGPSGRRAGADLGEKARAGVRRRLVTGLVEMAAHQLHAQEQEISLDNVAAAVTVDFVEAPTVVKLLDLDAGDIGFAGHADALEQQVEPATDPELTAVGEKVLQVQVILV